jgi:hypothetical protein
MNHKGSLEEEHGMKGEMDLEGARARDFRVSFFGDFAYYFSFSSKKLPYFLPYCCN